MNSFSNEKIISPAGKSYTPVEDPPKAVDTGPGTGFLLSGSCFAERLKSYLDDRFLLNKFSPAGISYNPFSIADCFDLVSGRREIDMDDIFLHKGEWKHSLFHGRFNVEDKDITDLSKPVKSPREIYYDNAIERINSVKKFINPKTIFIITLGTSWVYRRKSSGITVNNCHREDNSLFKRELLTTDEITGKLSDSLKPFQCSIIITVSPVRHLRDNSMENSLSKARLICAARELESELESVHYYPSWEIMMDELRDYRWYKPNLTSPSDEAGNYISARFLDWIGNSSMKSWLNEAGKLRKRLNHRVEKSGPEADAFIGQTEKIIRNLRDKYPHFNSFSNVTNL